MRSREIWIMMYLILGDEPLALQGDDFRQSRTQAVHGCGPGGAQESESSAASAALRARFIIIFIY